MDEFTPTIPEEEKVGCGQSRSGSCCRTVFSPVYSASSVSFPHGGHMHISMIFTGKKHQMKSILEMHFDWCVLVLACC